MTLDFSNPRDVVFYKDTIEFTVNDANFMFNGLRMVFHKDTQYVFVYGENEPFRYIENPNELFSRDDWKEYVSPEAVDIKPTKDNGFLMMQGTIRPKKDMVDQPSHYRRYGMESIDAVHRRRIHEDDASRSRWGGLGEGGEMKTSIWNWIAVVAITPGVLILIILTSPLLAAFVAYDLVFLGWRPGK